MHHKSALPKMGDWVCAKTVHSHKLGGECDMCGDRARGVECLQCVLGRRGQEISRRRMKLEKLETLLAGIGGGVFIWKLTKPTEWQFRCRGDH